MHEKRFRTRRHFVHCIFNDCAERDPRIQSFLDTAYNPKLIKFKSHQDLAEGVCVDYHENCDMISTAYHKEKSELIPFKGKKAAIAYWVQVAEQIDALGVKFDVHWVKVNGLKFTVKANVHAFNAKEEEVLDIEVEETITLNEEGQAVHIISVTQDFDIVKLHQKQMVHKAGPSINLDENKAVITCLDAEFNEVTYDLDLKENISKVNQIEKIVKDAENNKQDVMIVIVEPEQKNGKKVPIVSHAVIADT